ncbi:MAG: hypothetical protein K2G03_04600, partial [Bacilli bacterium]|nr:hypothetical protein [Bacilli bacterium]
LDILESKDALINFLKQLNDCYELVERVYLYPKRILDLDNTDSEAKEMMNRAIDLYNAYLKHENYYKKIIVENRSLVEEFVLKEDYWYRYLYLIIRSGEHIAQDDVLSEYNKRVPAIRNAYQTLLNDKIKFSDIECNGEAVEVTRKNYSRLLEDENQENRYKAFSSYMNGYKEYIEEITKLFVEKLENDIKLFKSEGYKSLIEKKLFELELNPDTLDNLIKSVNEHLNIMHNFVRIKKEKSGLDEFHTYDTYVASLGGKTQKLEYDESVELVKEALKPLGSEYLKIVDEMLNNGWVDVYPKEHKRINPSTSISFNGVPYVLLNYAKNLDGARMLCHETGHAIHTYFSKASKKVEYFEFELFLTEIVSKVNEILFNEYLLSQVKDDVTRKEILSNIVGSLGNSLFNQTMTTEFEHRVIKSLESGELIDSDYLNETYLEVMKKYNGDALTLDELNKYGWMLVTHLVWQESYSLYQYVTGLALGTSIALKIMNDENYIAKYLELLKVGRSKSIEDALKLVDIDINDKNYLDDALNYLKEKIYA